MPPSSSSIGTSRRAHASATFAPVAAEPTNVTWSTPGWRTSASPVLPSPVATWNIPARHARLVGDLREPQRRDRRQLGRLEDHRVARRQRGCGAAGGDLQRVVPGDDLRAHAPRLAHGVVERVRAERDRAAFEALDRARVVLEVADRGPHVGLRLRERLAGVAGLELGELLRLFLHPTRHPQERAGADERRAPVLLLRERAAGVLDVLGDLRGRRRRELGELVARSTGRSAEKLRSKVASCVDVEHGAGDGGAPWRGRRPRRRCPPARSGA